MPRPPYRPPPGLTRDEVVYELDQLASRCRDLLTPRRPTAAGVVVELIGHVIRTLDELDDDAPSPPPASFRDAVTDAFDDGNEAVIDPEDAAALASFSRQDPGRLLAAV